MRFKSIFFCVLVFMVCLIVTSISNGATNQNNSDSQIQEYKQEFSNIKDVIHSLKPGAINDLEDYVRFADRIQQKWKTKDKESYGRLILEICGPLSSGMFKSDKRYDDARKYALSVLGKPDEIPLELELNLTGHVVTLMYTPNSPKGNDFARLRKEDSEIRLHAWKRLIDNIDPKWDPNEELLSPNAIAGTFGFPGTIPYSSISDPKLRVEYEEAMKENQEKIERFNNQYRLNDWLKRYPKRTEEYIINLYSEKPYNLKELKQLLEKYKIDKETQTRIIEAVTKNMKNQAKNN